MASKNLGKNSVLNSIISNIKKHPVPPQQQNPFKKLTPNQFSPNSNPDNTQNYQSPFKQHQPYKNDGPNPNLNEFNSEKLGFVPNLLNAIKRFRISAAEFDPKSSPITYRDFSSIQFPYRQFKELVIPSNLNEINKNLLGDQYYTKVAIKEETILEAPHSSQVPKLRHGLDKMVHQPGLHAIPEDAQYIANITSINDFNFDALPSFVPPSKDDMLFDIAKESKCKFVGSTSSMTGVLNHIQIMLSQRWSTNFKFLSPYVDMETNFSPSVFFPEVLKLYLKDGVYFIDKHQVSDSASSNYSLTQMGQLLERMLTMDKEEFERNLVMSSDSYMGDTSESKRNLWKDCFHITKKGDLLMRSQIDCMDDSIPGPRKSFDLKTRASRQLRHHFAPWSTTSDGPIPEPWPMTEVKMQEVKITAPRAPFGKNSFLKTLNPDGTPVKPNTADLKGYAFQSYEVEFYDMLRGAMSKYSLQSRIGKMAGIFVAYHNITNLLSFEFISQEEMDRCLFHNTNTAQSYFDISTSILQDVLGKFTELYPGKPLKITVFPVFRPNYLHFNVRPYDSNEDLQSASAEEPGEFNFELLGQVVIKNGENAGQIPLPSVALPGEDLEAYINLRECRSRPLPEDKATRKREFKREGKLPILKRKF